MCDGMPQDAWTPFKFLYNVVEKSLTQPNHSSLSQLQIVLRKHELNFINLLENPGKNAKNRAQLKQGIIDGITLPGCGHRVLSKDLVDECIILSDMYNLDEYVALELLCTAEQQKPHHPGLPRGLVAVLLYYDGRKSLALALRDLFQARKGVSWCAEVPKEITEFITTYTSSLVEQSNLLSKIIDLLEKLDISKELEILTTNRALGPPKHHRQILDLFQDIRLALATALFNWSAQCGLSQCTAGKLAEYLAEYKPTEARGGLDDVTVTLTLALLYAFDTNALQRPEDKDLRENIEKLPIIKEPDYVQYLFHLLQRDWVWDNRLKSIIVFGLGLSMATLRRAPMNYQQNSLRAVDNDELLVKDAIKFKVFDFIHYVLLESEIIFKTEFFFRRINMLFTDFIEFMSPIVTELRRTAHETARTVQNYSQQGIDPSPNLDQTFKHLMLAIGKFYEGDKLNLELCLEYWSPTDIHGKSTNRSVSLFKFIRLAGELLPPSLFVPYLKMLSGLASCEQAARNAFNLLKQSTLSGSTTLSWDHFFGSLARYYSNLRQEQHPGSDTIYRNRVLNRCISPQEIEGLHAVLGIIRAVANYDEIARVALCEHPNWVPIQVLLGLLSCSVPLMLKAEILRTLSSLGKSKTTALLLWHNLEASQIIATIPTTSTYVAGGLKAEIEQNESRNEMYPLSQAILDLLYTLITTAIPKNLGGGPRKPGFDPYLTFIIEIIFLRFYNRNYKNPAEKWQVGEKCLKILNHFTKIYEANPFDFVENKDENSSPGYHIMLQMHTKSETLRLMLHLIDETQSNLDMYAPFPGKTKQEECALHCLNIIEKALSCQDIFFHANSVARSLILLSGLNRLLMDVNPRTGKPDHMLNITKFVTYNNWLPKHALAAIKILNWITRQPNTSSQLLGIFTSTEKIQNELRHGFVECLESDLMISSSVPSQDSSNEYGDEVELGLKESIINLLEECLSLPAPNISHYLLGFDITKDIRSTQLQRPGVLDFPSNCAKSLVALLDGNLEISKTEGEIDLVHERIINKAYGLLYALCFNQRTSDVFLRFLRSCDDFLCRHMSNLPFKNSHSAEIIGQMSSLLKCVAIELKMISTDGKVKLFEHMCKILLGNIGILQSGAQSANIPLELSHYSMIMNDLNVSEGINRNKFSADQRTGSDRILLCHLLNCVDFEAIPLAHPKWEFFDNTMTTQILQECEIENVLGPKLINVKKLHGILSDELNTVQSTIAAGQRQLILQEIESILKFSLEVNEQRNKCAATIKFTESWGQVTEILFSVAPSCLPNEIKQDLILEILQHLLSKIVPADVILEIGNLMSGTILILLVNLRCCYVKRSSSRLTETGNDYTTIGMGQSGMSFSNSLMPLNVHSLLDLPKSNTLSLKYILTNIIEWIIISGVTSQRLRVNLYASLLNYMHIIKKDTLEDESKKDENYVSCLDRSVISVVDRDSYDDPKLNKIQMTADVFSSFGEKLIDILCHDCISGHDICKTLALSCIDRFLDMDSLTNFIHFIAKRGYLSHIIDSLLKSDSSLCRVLRAEPENMKSLFVYESKMATLCRMANSYVGSELLLENKIFGVLSSMKVFGLHPDFQVNSYINRLNSNSFIPPVEVRYQQILFPALNLCDVVISTLGSENVSAVNQIMHFLLSHSDMVEIVLRAGTPFLSLGLLQELSGITSLVARTANQGFVALIEPNSAQEVGVHLYRLQRLMLSLFSRFIIGESVLKEMFKPENILYEFTDKNKALHIKYILEIAANLALYCRNSIVNHSVDHRTTGILFSPSVTETLQRTENRGGTLEIFPSLGIVVNQLKNCVEHYNKQKSVYDSLLRQKSSLQTNSDASNIGRSSLAADKISVRDLSERLDEKQQELSLCAFIVEHCLYLLWSHLDFYMKRGIPVPFDNKTLVFNNDTLISSPTEASWKVTTEDISNLKDSLIATLSETFCTQLLNTASNSKSAKDRSFTEALLRRVKSLIQFVPVN